jgi:hypothetical protein
MAIDLSQFAGEYTPREAKKLTAKLKQLIDRVKSDESECDHYFVPVGFYDQNGKFVCQKCGQNLK